ncbi:MAG: 50S ribosomal protein L11 methyltransferase [Gammaproteobacteria bacterium]|nr:50S ribosomal protein L11 methyltransferase [Gammaproteobacteria bacterium]
MPWIQLHIRTRKEHATLIEALLENMGALSVTYKDAEDEALLEPAPGEQPLWYKTQVTGLFPGDSDQHDVCDEINRRLSAELVESLQVEVLKDQTWERAWLRDFHPMRFGNRLWICPDGQRPESDSGVFIDLDPGLAFGTGTHPTTALCLEWLDHANLEGMRVLDYGCGSGILAIAALKLGAIRADVLDHDPQALLATRVNAEKNGVLEHLKLIENRALPLPADLVVANILAGTLIELKSEIAACTRPGGSVILSGILTDQWEAVASAYTGDFRIQTRKQKENWVLIEGQRLGAD